MANEAAYNSSDSDNFAYQASISGNSYGTCAIGTNTILGAFAGMIRFPTIPIAQGTSINYAALYFYFNTVGSSGNLKVKVYGVAEDNTGVLTGDPWARTLTSAVTAYNNARPNSGTYDDFVVTSQVNEILARGGWSSGNAMAFRFNDDTSDTNVWGADAHTGNTYLLIRTSPEPTFFPAATTVDPTGLPAIENIGIRISQPGIDVKLATEDQLYFTTRKKELHAKQELQKIIPTSGYSFTKINHGLPYAPVVLGYASGPKYTFKLNRYFSGATDPISEGIKGFILSTSTQIWISASGLVRYYTFLDPIP